MAEQNLNNSALPVGEERNFIGRTDVLGKIYGILSGDRPDRINAIVLWGVPYIGKTTIIQQLIKDLSEKRKCSFLDYNLKSKKVSSPNIKGLEPYRPLLESFFADPLSISDQMSDLLPPNTDLFLIFKEFDALDTSQYNDKNLSDFGKAIRHERLKFIFVVDRQPNEDTCPLLKDIQICHVSCLSRKKADQLVHFSADSLVWDQHSLDRIWSLTCGHPYLIQHICAVIMNQINQDTVKPADIDTAIPDTLRRIDGAMRKIWKKLTDAEQRIAYILANSSVSLETLSNATKLPDNDLKDALQILQKWGLVKQTDNKRYYFQTELIGQWVEQLDEIETKDILIAIMVGFFVIFILFYFL